MNDHHDPDEPLVGQLRRYFAEVDPVPEVVTQAAKAAFGWRRLDAELAELLSDSALEHEGAALSYARGAGAPVRSVSFSAGELTIELEIHVQGDERMLLGQLLPASARRIEIQTMDNPAVQSQPDALGRFRARLTAGGPIRLRLGPADRSSAAWVETSWITV